MNKKLSSNKLAFEEEDYNIEIKKYNQGNYDILYLDNFEILNEEIIPDLVKIGILKKDNIIKGGYVAGDKKILFYFEKVFKKYFQINSFDCTTNTFIIDYLIEEKNNFALEYFKKFGINYLLDKMTDKAIILANEIICNCYAIKSNKLHNEEVQQSIIPMDSDINDKYIINVIEFLISYQLFNFDIQKKISDFHQLEVIRKRDIKLYNYYIVNKKIIAEFLNLFWDENINIIIKENKLSYDSNINDNILKYILQDKNMEKYIKRINDKIENFKQKIKYFDIFEINTLYINENNNLIFYPKDLMFLDESLLSKFINLFELKISDTAKKNNEISLNFNF